MLFPFDTSLYKLDVHEVGSACAPEPTDDIIWDSVIALKRRQSDCTWDHLRFVGITPALRRQVQHVVMPSITKTSSLF